MQYNTLKSNKYLGCNDNNTVGTALGVSVEVDEGLGDGLRVLEGIVVGSPVGMYVGSEMGLTEGKSLVGERVDLTEGDLVGFVVGDVGFRDVGLIVATLLLPVIVGTLVGAFFEGFAEGEKVNLVVGAKEEVGDDVGALLATFAYGFSGWTDLPNFFARSQLRTPPPAGGEGNRPIIPNDGVNVGGIITLGTAIDGTVEGELVCLKVGKAVGDMTVPPFGFEVGARKGLL